MVVARAKAYEGDVQRDDEAHGYHYGWVVVVIVVGGVERLGVGHPQQQVLVEWWT